MRVFGTYGPVNPEEHYAEAHSQLLEETNANISHLLTNIRRNPSFESVLMRIASYETGLRFNPDDEIISELATYGVITKGTEEFVGQHLLYAYLDQFVQLIHGHIYLEGQTGRGKIDLAIFHNARKYIVETKIWEGPRSYQAGKKQLAAYLNLENVSEGYYVVFDHRADPEPRIETETIDGLTIRSYVIPVVQEAPSQQT